jgi:molecular chaperone DnaK
LTELFGRQPEISINPDEVVAHGAAIQAGSLSGNLSSGTGMGEKIGSARQLPVMMGGTHLPATAMSRPLLLDVNPSTLAIQTAGGFTEILLEKNSPIPIERTRVFSTVRDRQSRVEIDCCRGEARRYIENEPLGTLVLENLPEKQRGELQVEVTFRVDTDGILHVRARDAQSGAEQKANLSVIGAPTR